jgi:hypothetical protein
VEKLRNVQPHESCFDKNLEAEYIKEVRERYNLKPKNIVCSHTNELVKLVMEYDVSRLEAASRRTCPGRTATPPRDGAAPGLSTGTKRAGPMPSARLSDSA